MFRRKVTGLCVVSVLALAAACSASDAAPAPVGSGGAGAGTGNGAGTGGAGDGTAGGAAGGGADATGSGDGTTGGAPSAGGAAGGADDGAAGGADPGNSGTGTAGSGGAQVAQTATEDTVTETAGGGAFVEEGDSLIVTEAPEEETPEGQLVDGKVCSSQEVAFEKTIPTVMLVLDRSTSMFRSDLANGSSPSPFGAYSDRWEALTEAVKALEPYSADVQFAAVTYTGYNASNGGTCPEVQGLDIAAATGNFDQILALLPPSEEAIPDSKSETPTAEGMQQALEVLLAVEAEGPKYMVLVTDGLPEHCAGNPELLDKGVWCGHDPAFAVVQEAYAAGVTTYVIGIIEGANDSEADAGAYFLNGIAHAGQGLEVQPPPSDNLHCIQQESRIARDADPDNDFYQNWRPWAAATYAEDGFVYADDLYFAPSDTDLGPQLGQVVQATRSCEFEMDEAVVRAQASKGVVRFEFPDGSYEDLAFQGADGWDLAADNDYTVVVAGEACTQVQTDAVSNVKIQFPCETRVARVR